MLATNKLAEQSSVQERRALMAGERRSSAGDDDEMMRDACDFPQANPFVQATCFAESIFTGSAPHLLQYCNSFASSTSLLTAGIAILNIEYSFVHVPK